MSLDLQQQLQELQTRVNNNSTLVSNVEGKITSQGALLTTLLTKITILESQLATYKYSNS